MIKTIRDLSIPFSAILALGAVLSTARADDRAQDAPAETSARQQPPRASFGVMQCGEVVAIWVVTNEGKLFRTDAEHHPDTAEEYNAFLEWLTTAQEDIYTLPCPGDTAGGKPHEKATT